MDLSGSFQSGSNGPQKRVLPSRTRRGGPGVGSCDADLLILEHQKRRFETEALIPPDTPFLLSTNSKQFSTSNDSLQITIVPNERYFDRPEVLEAFRNKQILPTPEWNEVGIPDVGRFRPRGPEDTHIDTSDAAYERRHKKYENFEKRQRLREKEKLKHEQYKLKERIEQLRIMDSSAFLTLPASNFSPAPGVPEDEVDAGLAALPGVHVNGAAAHNEGERRRKEMLDIALTLEARFRVLLPPEKIRKPQTQRTTRENTVEIPATIHPQLRRAVSDAEISEREDEIVVDGDYDQRQEIPKIKLKLSGKDSASQSPAPTSLPRNSKRSQPTSAHSTKSYQRRKSRPVVNAYHPSEPPPFPRVYVEGQLRGEDAEEDEDEDEDEDLIPTLLDGRASAAIPRGQELYQRFHVPQAGEMSSGPPSIPPQKQAPLPDTRTEHGLENTVALSGRVSLPAENFSEAPQHEVENVRAVSTPIDIETLQEPAPRRRYPSPSPIETILHGPLPRTIKVKASARRRLGRPSKMTEDYSKLLDLANAAASSSNQPPSKRTKTRHPPSPPKSREHSDQLSQDTEEEPVPESPCDSAFTPFNVEKGALTNGTFGIATTTGHRSGSVERVGSPTAPTVPPTSFPMLPLEATSSISEAAKFRRARGVVSGRKSNVEYQSDTGALRRTESLLLIASIRGSSRQTQRHQMAFGVKVPEEISTPYDFWPPDEYLPEEEVKYYTHTS